MTYESIETRVHEGVFSLVITPSVGPEIVIALPGDAPSKIARMLLWESGHKYMDNDTLLDSLMDRTCDDESESVEDELWRRVDESEYVWRCICCAGGSQIRVNRGCDMCEMETLR